MLFTEGGPPDPISYLRGIAACEHGGDESDYLRRSDAADGLCETTTTDDDDGYAGNDKVDEGAEGGMDSPPQQGKNDTTRVTSTGSNRIMRRIQDPPARERPSEGQAWPYRDTFSFPRTFFCCCCCWALLFFFWFVYFQQF